MLQSGEKINSVLYKQNLSVHYYDPKYGRIRRYYPDFLAKIADGSYQLMDVKGDKKTDNIVAKAKQAAAEEMDVASSVEVPYVRWESNHAFTYSG